jgi:hypothetical protein
MPTESKRHLLFNPRIAPHTFVFFFHKGPGETSWSVRDYSRPGGVAIRHAAEFQDAAGRTPPACEILAASAFAFPAAAHPTTDLAYWHDAVAAKNAAYLTDTPPAAAPAPPLDPPSAAVFPVLDLPRLMASPKAGKRGDIERILTSQNSEDWVTWNFFQLLDRVPAARWWPQLLRLAGAASLDPADCPTVRLWQAAPAPCAYEALSRRRLRASDNPAWRERSLKPDPVEGASEIDITLEGRGYLIYVEAKLGSDLSLTTTYDPERNQIARNIDCVLEYCGPRRPAFWMFVRDRAATRAYVQLMDRYRAAAELRRALPHREEARLAEIASGLAIITWAELLPLLAGAARPGIEAQVEAELCRRVRVL